MSYYQGKVVITREGDHPVEITVEFPQGSRMVAGDTDKDAKRDALMEVASLDLGAILADRIDTHVEITLYCDY